MVTVNRFCRRGSVVERTLGKGEVESSILSGGTTCPPYKCYNKIQEKYSGTRTMKKLFFCLGIISIIGLSTTAGAGWFSFGKDKKKTEKSERKKDKRSFSEKVLSSGAKYLEGKAAAAKHKPYLKVIKNAAYRQFNLYVSYMHILEKTKELELARQELIKASNELAQDWQEALNVGVPSGKIQKSVDKGVSRATGIKNIAHGPKWRKIVREARKLPSFDFKAANPDNINALIESYGGAAMSSEKTSKEESLTPVQNWAKPAPLPTSNINEKDVANP